MDTRVHISLEVSDLGKAVAFYSGLFRQEPTKRRDDYANFRLESPQLHLALVHRPGRLPEPGTGSGNNRHYGVELFADDKLSAWLKSAQEAGLKPLVEDAVTCCYAVANKFWARDPDGHEWEFWVRHGEADVMHESERQSTPNAKTCCAPGQC